MEIRPVETFARVIALLGVLVVVGGVAMYLFGVVRSEPRPYVGQSTPAPAPSAFKELPVHAAPGAESSPSSLDAAAAGFQSDAVDSTASSGTQANIFQIAPASPASGTPR